VDHDRGVPSDICTDATLEEFITRELRLRFWWNRVHVIGQAEIWKIDVVLVSMLEEREHEVTSTRWASKLDQRIQGLMPFGGLFRVGIDELVDVEVLGGVNLVLAWAHGPIFASKGE
jgi:hypothetical protein